MVHDTYRNIIANKQTCLTSPYEVYIVLSRPSTSAKSAAVVDLRRGRNSSKSVFIMSTSAHILGPPKSSWVQRSETIQEPTQPVLPNPADKARCPDSCANSRPTASRIFEGMSWAGCQGIMRLCLRQDAAGAFEA